MLSQTTLEDLIQIFEYKIQDRQSARHDQLCSDKSWGKYVSEAQDARDALINYILENCFYTV